VALLSNGTTATITSPVIHEGGLTFSFVLPFFQQLAIIDPDFSVVFQSNNGDGGSNNLLPLISIAVVVVIPLAFLVAGGAFATYLYIKRRANRKKITTALEMAQLPASS